MKKEREKNIGLAKCLMEEIRMLASSVSEDISDSRCMTEAWDKVDRFYQDVESMRNRQKCTGSKSFSIMQNEVDGHTKYLQGINLPIMVNSVVDADGNYIPQPIAEMHIALVNDKQTLVITPAEISLPD